MQAICEKPCFIYHWIMNEELRRKAEARMTGSAGQRRVPIINDLNPFFDIKEGSKEFYVRYDLITDFTPEHGKKPF